MNSYEFAVRFRMSNTGEARVRVEANNEAQAREAVVRNIDYDLLEYFEDDVDCFELLPDQGIELKRVYAEIEPDEEAA